MTTVADTQPRTYGGWTRPESAGLFKLGLLGTALLFALLAFALLVSRYSLLNAFFVLALGAAAIAPLSLRTRHGQTGWEIIGNWVGWHVTRLTGQTSFRSGPLSPAGRFALPGIAASIEVHDATDAFG